MATRDQILNADDIESTVVVVPQWGDAKVEVRAMDGRTRARFLKNATGEGGQVDFERFYVDLLVSTAHDPETGERMFTVSDREALNAKSGAAIDIVAQEALRLSGLSNKAVKEAKDDLDEAQSDDSTTT